MLFTFSIKAIKMKVKKTNCQKIDVLLEKHISKYSKYENGERNHEKQVTIL